MSYSILVIEDNKKHSFILEDMLNDEGYEVDIAKNGNEVRNRMNEKENNQKQYDLILVDIAVPAFNAITFLKDYRDKYRIIVISAYADRPDIAAQLEEKWQIKKPFDTNILLEKIKERMKLPVKI